jgi:protein-S-isoprenylcysteine O-methyltransferase Ste14
MRGAAVVYGVVAYLAFLLSFLYAVGFIADLVVPKTINSGPAASAPTAVVIDLILLGIFAVQHSGMARPAFKRMWTRWVPEAVERSTYVLAASASLALICGGWSPIPGVVWSVSAPWAAAVIWIAFAAGWLIVLTSTFMISHWDLFGLRQVWSYRRAGETPPPEFRTPLFYRVVRHPLYLGFIVSFWAAPTMTWGRLLFAGATTAYVLIAIQLEEHDLLGVFGEQYAAYRRKVSMLLPLPRRAA